MSCLHSLRGVLTWHLSSCTPEDNAARRFHDLPHLWVGVIEAYAAVIHKHLWVLLTVPALAASLHMTTCLAVSQESLRSEAARCRVVGHA